MTTVTIRCVYDEGAKVNTSLIGAKGSALLLEADGQRTLFGTGKSGRYLIHNMEILNAEPDSYDRVVIPCGSLDVIGGLDAFMDRRTKKVDVYSRPNVWATKRLLSPLIKEDNVGGLVKHEVSDWTELSRSLVITPPISSAAEELALVVPTPKGAVVVSAGAYDGLMHTLDLVKGKYGKIRAVVGGANLLKVKQQDVNAIAARLTDDFGSPQLHLNGTTSAEGTQKLRVALGKDAVHDFFAGYELEF